jgi:membrane-bound lytic murein transglycosylase B
VSTTDAEPTGSSSGRVTGRRPLVWTLAIGIAVSLLGLVAAVFAAILPPQLVVPVPNALGAAVVPVPTPGQATIQQVGASGVVDSSWIDRVAAATGIPGRALSAYADADLATAASQPGCHLRWNVLAGIGLIESNHGRHGGAVLTPDGTTSIPIIGPALDGTNGTRALSATPAGTGWHGDARWEHAIGPMQFLPSTWLAWGRTLHARTPDPNNIDDAALTAAAYLCAKGRDLTTPAGWRSAIGSYNAPDAYANSVTDAANRYARESLA